MIPFVAIVVALGCALASARRVWFAANATAIHPDEIVRALSRATGRDAVDALRAIVAKEPAADWERDLLEALSAPAAQRVALVNEQLTELDYRIQRWARVPRVCARMAASFGFLLATLVLRKGLGDFSELPQDVMELVVFGLVGDALTVAAMGIVGMAFCIGANSEAQKIAKERSAAADKLVERLEGLMGQMGHTGAS